MGDGKIKKETLREMFEKFVKEKNLKATFVGFSKILKNVFKTTIRRLGERGHSVRFYCGIKLKENSRVTNTPRLVYTPKNEEEASKINQIVNSYKFFFEKSENFYLDKNLFEIVKNEETFWRDCSPSFNFSHQLINETIFNHFSSIEVDFYENVLQKYLPSLFHFVTFEGTLFFF